MSNNLPKRPVRFQTENRELLKSMGANYSEVKGKTDYQPDSAEASVPVATMRQQYRTPHPGVRVDGNCMFRRYMNGVLDYEYASHKVIDAIHRAKQGVESLGPEDLVMLQLMFPNQFNGPDGTMVAAMVGVQLQLLPAEYEMIRARVASHLLEELNYNAGRGGGSVPGRHQTVA